MKTIARNVNQAGKQYALITDGKVFWVLARSVNYRQGKDIISWSKVFPKQRFTNQEFQTFAKIGMGKESATKLYNRKLAGKTKY